MDGEVKYKSLKSPSANHALVSLAQLSQSETTNRRRLVVHVIHAQRNESGNKSLTFEPLGRDISQTSSGAQEANRAADVCAIDRGCSGAVSFADDLMKVNSVGGGV